MTRPRESALLDASTTDCLGNPLPGTKEVQLVPREDAPADLTMFERFLRDPAVDPDKLERFMNLQERAQRHTAEQAFNVAMAAAQGQMKRVAQDADNPQTKSRYASYAALDRALRPIYTEHGFALSFNTADSPMELHVRVLCDVTHVAGHTKPYHIDMPADGKGAKGGDVMTRTHATGSAISYGMRYLLRMIFNVAVGQEDDDGNAASGRRQAPARVEASEPHGFAEWAEEMGLKADEGLEALKAAWEASDTTLRSFVAHHRSQWWQQTKARAAKADARAK